MKVNQTNQLKQERNYTQCDICIHQHLDVFGFQELFVEETNPLYTHSVVCLQPNSIVVSIQISDLQIHVRRNPDTFKLLVDNWDHLVDQRMNQQELTGAEKDG